MPEGAVGARKIDALRGSLDGSVSSQWFARPDDQRFLSLEALMASVRARADRSLANTYSTRALRVSSDNDWSKDSLRIVTPDGVAAPTHWSFGQLCSRVGAPAGFLRELQLAPAVLQERLLRSNAEEVKILRTIDPEGNEVAELRAVTGPEYGRVWDWEVVEAVQNIASRGEWKVPGVINWNTGVYDPNPDYVSKESTTLYASDRDVFIFLVRDQYPIEVGKLASGEPDYLFPGFIVSNSETGSRSLCIETMYLRGVCMNRNLWGCENKQSLRMRHSKGLPSRFAAEAMPRLEDFSNISASAVARKVMEAKRLDVAKNDDEAVEFLQKRDFSKKSAKDIIALVTQEEGHPPRSVWDFVNGITASARSIAHQDDRVDLERKAGSLMDAVKI